MWFLFLCLSGKATLGSVYTDGEDEGQTAAIKNAYWTCLSIPDEGDKCLGGNLKLIISKSFSKYLSFRQLFRRKVLNGLLPKRGYVS